MKKTALFCMCVLCVCLMSGCSGTEKDLSESQTENLQAETLESYKEMQETDLSVFEEPEEVAVQETERVAEFNLSSFKNSMDSGRPEYTASDYVTLPEYLGIEVTAAVTQSVTDDTIEEQVEKDCERVGIEYKGSDALTNEDAALITDQYFLNAEDYLSDLRIRLELYSVYQLKENTFMNLLTEIADDIVFDGYPEDVYEYDLGTSGAGVLDYEVMDNLTVDMMLRAMAEDLGIEEGGSVFAFKILMTEYGLYDYNDLYYYFTEDELIRELLGIDVINEVTDQAVIVPISYGEETEN